MNDTKSIHEELLERIIPSFREEIFSLNDWMALNPEIGSQEFHSSKRIVDLLRKHGLEVEYPYCGLATSFKASVNPGTGRKKVALLAEYDALPELGHACGHCAGGSAAVMAILAFHQIREQLGEIQIDIIGTPDEEMGGGTACNIVPDFTRVAFETRAPLRAQLDDITAWVKECAQAAAMATRTDLTILSHGENYDDFQTGPIKNQLLADCFHVLNLEVDSETVVSGGSSDIGNVNTVCPAFHPMISIGEHMNTHTREFAEAMTTSRTHEAIQNGAKVLAELCHQFFHRANKLDLL